MLGGDCMNRLVAYGLLGSAASGIIAWIFSYNFEFSGAMYTLAGLGFYVFSVWGAVLLLKN